MPAGKPPLDINFKAAGASVALYKTKLHSFLEPVEACTGMLSRDPGGDSLTQTSAKKLLRALLRKNETQPARLFRLVTEHHARKLV